eukprot:g16617.t1
MSDTWCTIESDPGVFTELIESVGVRGVQVEELYSLDDDSFNRLQPIYGLVFLFKWTGESDDRAPIDAGSQPELFFARQVIPNACATQAILSVLLNCADKVDLGETLSDFKAFTAEFPPDLKGLAISNSETIRSVHNGFSRQEPFFNDGQDPGGKKEDAFHFVAYLPHKNKVFELDGLKSGPILLGEIPPAGDGEAARGDWLRIVSPAIEKRITRYASGEIRFNLMAIVKNRRQVALEGKEGCVLRMEAIDQALSEEGNEGKEDLQSQRVEELHATEKFNLTIADEEAKFARWRKENVRRKQNYVPFAVALLSLLADKGTMQGQIDSAATKASERREAMAAAKTTTGHPTPG